MEELKSKESAIPYKEEPLLIEYPNLGRRIILPENATVHRMDLRILFRERILTVDKLEETPVCIVDGWLFPSQSLFQEGKHKDTDEILPDSNTQRPHKDEKYYEHLNNKYRVGRFNLNVFRQDIDPDKPSREAGLFCARDEDAAKLLIEYFSTNFHRKEVSAMFFKLLSDVKLWATVGLPLQTWLRTMDISQIQITPQALQEKLASLKMGPNDTYKYGPKRIFRYSKGLNDYDSPEEISIWNEYMALCDRKKRGIWLDWHTLPKQRNPFSTTKSVLKRRLVLVYDPLSTHARARRETLISQEGSKQRPHTIGTPLFIGNDNELSPMRKIPNFENYYIE